MLDNVIRGRWNVTWTRNRTWELLCSRMNVICTNSRLIRRSRRGGERGKKWMEVDGLPLDPRLASAFKPNDYFPEQKANGNRRRLPLKWTQSYSLRDGHVHTLWSRNIQTKHLSVARWRQLAWRLANVGWRQKQRYHIDRKHLKTTTYSPFVDLSVMLPMEAAGGTVSSVCPHIWARTTERLLHSLLTCPCLDGPPRLPGKRSRSVATQSLMTDRSAWTRAALGIDSCQNLPSGRWWWQLLSPFTVGILR